eukprot:CAMPEP_0179124156 /NCGR_PEP_ID=MMETSP0796-20121207/58660_1 /TAXON_ID=73915 /ORGANISM="Pyrodinium bahamense, Strain pbaha01" /LENGTH=992 /DNA_ID=CAMNT_0020822809 /DNA_START=21 /DNA_END=2999 /DNA_ORIENTATION=+
MGAQCCKGGQAEGLEEIAQNRGLDKMPLTHSDVDALNNIIILTDSYKVTHHVQYPPCTETVYSYFESRGGLFSEICFFGLQYFLKRYLVGKVVTAQKIDEAEYYFRRHFSHPVWEYREHMFNRKGWEYILSEHDGRLPIAIKAVPEGTVLPWKNVLFTVENTDPECYWLTCYVESLLVQVWYPTTVCTQSREMKKIILKYLHETGCNDTIEKGTHLFKLHDFGFRGVSSVESAALGGSAHLVNFLGSDTLAALMLAKEFYHADPIAGYSIPASEHSTITTWGPQRELDAFRNMLEQYPKGPVACVSDSYDIFNACEQYWGTDLKDKIEKRNGTLIVRPDSGDLPTVLLQVLEKLAGKFGSTQTATGHKKLPECVRVIQGDGVDINTLDTILRAMKKKGWAAENVAFGSGGALLQKVHRDTQKFAFKCSLVRINGEGLDVSKDPITDPEKRSKRGKLTLELRDGQYVTVGEGNGRLDCDLLREVYRDGRLLVDEPFRTIRERSDGGDTITSPGKPLETACETNPYGNILMMTDSYKVTHHCQYPPGTEVVYSYFESRGGAFEEVCFFGLQYAIKKYLVGPVVTKAKIDQAQQFFRSHFKGPSHGYDEKLFNRSNWEYILEKYGGHLPILIKALPEGTVLPTGNVLFTMENLDPKCFWLTNYLETLLVQVWYATTVCTQSREQKKLIVKYLRETGGEDTIQKGLHLFKLHDFGFRGSSSPETAAVGGAAHLVNFVGSDTLSALVMLRQHYNMDCAGCSVPSTEHSTITAWGKEKELDAFRNMLQQFPTGIISCVSDSYDIWNACEQYWGTDLKDMVANRDGVLYIRPDSGELPKTVLKVLEKLEAKFGSTRTSTGHRLLPSYIRVVQGDSIDRETLERILKAMSGEQWAIDNLTFGSGGALLQKIHRDVLKFAMKCSYAKINGEDCDVQKDPITDPGKRSKKGRLTLERRGEAWVTVQGGQGDAEKDELREVFRSGRLVVDDSFEVIRKRSELY